jgi:hypothetical protein
MGKKYAAARINASRFLRRKKQSDAYLLTTRGGESVISVGEREFVAPRYA